MTAPKPLEQAVLRMVQEPLPLCERPFSVLAEQLACSEETLLDQIHRLKTDGLIRRYRPQINYRALGRVAVLVGAAIPEGRLEQTAAAVSALGGVSHNYQRDGRLNLWFTLQDTSIPAIDAALERLRQTTGFAFYSFPAEKVYKLDVRFDPAGPGPMWFVPGRPGRTPMETTTTAALTPDEKQVLERLQQELPLVSQPFDQMLPDTTGTTPVALLKSLTEKGVLGKIAAVLNYRRLGYAANAMVCIAAGTGRIHALGNELARIPAVTHCYRRRTVADWPYALYAMFHAETPGRIDAFARSFCHQHSAVDYAVLPTVREFKKTPVRITF